MLARAGVEGTISQAVGAFGLRHCRYLGLAKTHLQHIATAAAPDAVTVRNMLGGIVTAYTRWIAEQRTQAPTDSPQRAKVAQSLLDRAAIANQRIEAGLQALDDPQILEAFQIANRAIATAIRQRLTHDTDKSPDELSPPKWRLFQIAFLLMNIVGIADPLHSDRELVDLLRSSVPLQ
ncbi:MAG TPA: hypothetical protein DCY91_01770 [Cyanobacteria bacterium UBA11370]|nr:hypothetical protein [Cyanobacteria bacterium UBA11370]HBY80935.1 hypothetical protein [Cyanobacteria bacterium UBA11148]